MVNQNSKYIYKTFDTQKDIIYAKPQILSFPTWKDVETTAVNPDDSVLTSIWLHGDETGSWESNYYFSAYTVSEAVAYNISPVFSIAFGTTYTASCTDITDTNFQYAYPSYATYAQFRSLLLNGESDFKLPLSVTSSNYSTIDNAYFIALSRDVLHASIDTTKFQLNLSGSGEYWLNGSVPSTPDTFISLIVHTSSMSNPNVQLITTGRLSTFSGQSTTILDDTPVGLIYPNKGIVVLDAIFIEESIGFSKDYHRYGPFKHTGSAVQTQANQSYVSKSLLFNIYGLINSGQYFKSLSTDTISTTHYFCRVNSTEYTNSLNPTWYSDTTKSTPLLGSDSPTYITTIGLYDGEDAYGNLVAVAKVSRPIRNDKNTELVIKVNIGF